MLVLFGPLLYLLMIVALPIGLLAIAISVWVTVLRRRGKVQGEHYIEGEFVEEPGARQDPALGEPPEETGDDA